MSYHVIPISDSIPTYGGELTMIISLGISWEFWPSNWSPLLWASKLNKSKAQVSRGGRETWISEGRLTKKKNLCCKHDFFTWLDGCTREDPHGFHPQIDWSNAALCSPVCETPAPGTPGTRNTQRNQTAWPDQSASCRAEDGTNSRDSNDCEWIVGIKTMEVVEQEKPPGFK